MAKRKSVIDLSNERDANRNARGKAMFKDGVNQRANIKQRSVADVIREIAPCEVRCTETSLCKRTLTFEKLEYVKELNLSYYSKNNLFSRIFDLIVSSSFKAEEKSSTYFAEQIEVGIEYNGSLKRKSVIFQPIENNAPSINLTRKLNSVDLLKSRVLDLDLVDLKIVRNNYNGEWSVQFAMNKGSVVWMLFPPLIMLTPLKSHEAVLLLESIQLISFEVMEFEKSFKNVNSHT